MQVSKFSAYLWGIETWSRTRISGLSYWVFSVPMRNWNSGLPGWFQEWPHRFQRTYEELKPTEAGVTAGPFRRFQRTYEELKLDADVAFFRHRLQVFSVPMRNWNQVREFVGILGDGRFQRTYEELKQPTFRYPSPVSHNVFSVPMRNWNKAPLHRCF